MSCIDLVITWVNNEDQNWIESFNKYKKLEKSFEVNNKDFNGECRYRDLGLLKYWFRSIETNCDWFNKIFLILSDEHQIPDWLNIKNKKLRIVYHNEFIPNELLPTFNSNTIELFIPRIEDLSEHYVLFNDDMFINNTLSDRFFFYNDKPVLDINKTTNNIICKDPYLKCLYNDYNFLKKHFNINYRFLHNHLTAPQVKSFNSKILEENFEEIYNSVCISRFRNSNNLTRYIYDDALKVSNEYIYDNNYKNSKLISLNDKFNINFIKNYDVICLNDNGLNTKFDDIKNNLINYFDTKYNNFSSFENPLVSVIIPVWNQENLIIKCIDSIPKLNEIEIIVIDDNSTDNTFNNLIAYRNNNNNITIYHLNENKGPGYARNIGIDYSKGKYIVMIDSDDYINTNQFIHILSILKNSDKDIIYTLKTRINGEKWISKWSMQGDFILKSFIGSIRHNDKLSGEDTDFSNKLRSKNPNSLNINNDWFYYYNEPRTNSLSWNKKHNVDSKTYISSFYR